MSTLSIALHDYTRILIVDDDPAARETLQAILSELYDVEVVADAEQAERALAVNQAQVLLTDYEMPGRSGIELISLVFEKYPEVVPVLLTGHTNKKEVRLADQKGNVFSVLGKPYDPDALMQTVRRAAATAKLRVLSQGINKKKSGR
jgi:two-component system response regulator HupR/HoxA